MKIKHFTKKSQAMIEMAILGSVVLMAFGALVTYIVKLNGDQYQLMQAFRGALHKSHNDNKAVAYGTWDDRRQAAVTNPIIGQKITSTGAGYVMWAIPSVEDNGGTSSSGGASGATGGAAPAPGDGGTYIQQGGDFGMGGGGGGTEVEKTMYMAINSAGGRFGPPLEYQFPDLDSGGIAPSYITTTGDSVTTHTVNGHTTSTRTGFSAEVMIYEIGGKQHVVQGRGHAVTR